MVVCGGYYCNVSRILVFVCGGYNSKAKWWFWYVPNIIVKLTCGFCMWRISLQSRVVVFVCGRERWVSLAPWTAGLLDGLVVIFAHGSLFLRFAIASSKIL